jgi:hypothetical protein
MECIITGSRSPKYGSVAACISTLCVFALLFARSALALDKRPRVGYGEVAPAELLPYFIQVNTLDKYDDSFCGGTIISPGWVLTAAHCVVSDGRVPYSGISYTLYQGNYSDNVTLIVPNTTSPVYIPDEYHPSVQSFEQQFFGDVALISVPELRDLNITYPRLPYSRKEVDSAPILVGVGIGMEETQSLADRVEFVSVTQEELGYTPPFSPFPIETDHFVAKDNGGEYQDTCAGDSGGGLFLPSTYWDDVTEDPELDAEAREITNERDVIVGITSYGSSDYGCGSKGSFGVYTDVFYWKEWIEEIIEES